MRSSQVRLLVVGLLAVSVGSLATFGSLGVSARQPLSGPGPYFVGQITLPAGSNPVALEYFPEGNKIFLYDQASDSLLTFDTTTEQFLPGSIPLPGDRVGMTSSGLAISRTSAKVFVGANDPATTGKIVIVNALSGVVEGQPLNTGCNGSLKDLHVNEATGKLWFTCFKYSGNGVIGVVDIATRTVNTIATGDVHYYTSMAIDEARNEVYVTELASNRLVIVNGVTLNVQYLYFWGVANQPDFVAVNPTEHKVYVYMVQVAGQAEPGICIIDLDVTPLHCTVVGKGDYGDMAFNPLTNRIFAAGEVGGTGAVIEGASDQLTDVLVPQGSTATVVRESTDNAYVFACDSIGIINGGLKSCSTFSLRTCGGGIAILDAAVNQNSGRVYSIHSGSAGPSPAFYIMQDGPLGPTVTPTPAPVGGIAELPDANPSPQETAGSSSPGYAALAGTMAVAIAVAGVLAASAWYARRRRLR